jgi:hypothetical protein
VTGNLNRHFFRKRFALAIARLRQGARTEAMDAPPPLEMNFNPDAAAASAFSLTIRRYSAGEQVFCTISSVRRVIVSQEANIRSVTVPGSDKFLRRLRAFTMNASPMAMTIAMANQRSKISDVPGRPPQAA